MFRSLGNLISSRCNPEIKKKYTSWSQPPSSSSSNDKILLRSSLLWRLSGTRNFSISCRDLSRPASRYWTHFRETRAGVFTDKSCPRFRRFMKLSCFLTTGRYQFTRPVGFREISLEGGCLSVANDANANLTTHISCIFMLQITLSASNNENVFRCLTLDYGIVIRIVGIWFYSLNQSNGIWPLVEMHALRWEPRDIYRVNLYQQMKTDGFIINALK